MGGKRGTRAGKEKKGHATDIFNRIVSSKQALQEEVRGLEKEGGKRGTPALARLLRAVPEGRGGLLLPG